MSKFILSKAMGSIPDDMLQEAMEVEKRRPVGKVIFRAVACLAVVIGLLIAALLPNRTGDLVIGPGVLVVTVYAADETPVSISSPDTVLHSSLFWDVAVSSSVGCLITLSVSDEYSYSGDITFEITIDGGGMLEEVESSDQFTQGKAYRYMPPKFTVPNHTNVYWRSNYPGSQADEYSMTNRNTANVQVIIYDGQEIVGYTVLRFVKMTCSEVTKANPEWIDATNHKYCAGDHKTSCYRIEMLASVFYPRIEGKYQTIKEEYVNEQIEKVKQG